MTTTSEKDVRLKIVEFREKMQLSVTQLAHMVDISTGLMQMIEEGEVTAPGIALRIGKVVGLTELETEELMPVNRRPHHPDYDPSKYVIPDTIKTYSSNTIQKKEMSEEKKELARKNRKAYNDIIAARGCKEDTKWARCIQGQWRGV